MCESSLIKQAMLHIQKVTLVSLHSIETIWVQHMSYHAHTKTSNWPIPSERDSILVGTLVMYALAKLQYITFNEVIGSRTNSFIG